MAVKGVVVKAVKRADGGREVIGDGDKCGTSLMGGRFRGLLRLFWLMVSLMGRREVSRWAWAPAAISSQCFCFVALFLLGGILVAFGDDFERMPSADVCVTDVWSSRKERSA